MARVYQYPFDLFRNDKIYLYDNPEIMVCKLPSQECESSPNAKINIGAIEKNVSEGEFIDTERSVGRA